jgi:hypothetical protein
MNYVKRIQAFRELMSFEEQRNLILMSYVEWRQETGDRLDDEEDENMIFLNYVKGIQASPEVKLPRSLE